MKGRFKKLIIGITSVCMLVSSMPMVANANVISSSDIQDALSASDFDTVESLVRTEAVSDPSLTVNATITVDENNEIKDFNWNILGMQNEVMHSGDIFFNKFTNEFTDGFMAMADILYDIPTARWGGGTANSVGLLENIGPLNDREQSIGIAGTPYGNSSAGKVMSEPTDMGPVEFIKMIQAINPNASFMFCLPLDVNTPEQTLNFTRFLLDDKDASQWGALRASLGIENPVNLLGYELGNEDYFSAEPSHVNSGYDDLSDEEQSTYNTSSAYITLRDAAIDRYVNTSNAHIAAIHAVYPNVKFYPNVNGEPGRVSCEAWDRAVASRICNQAGVDGVAYHAYYAGHATTITNENKMNTIQNWFVSETGAKTKFVHTEHAKWSANESITRQSHHSALCESFFINRMQMRDDVISANYHNITCGSSATNPGTWAFFTRKGDKYYEAGINKVYKLYTENMGNKIVSSTVTIASTHQNNISVLATKKNDGKIVLSLTNYYEDRDIDINFNLNGQYELSKESVFTAPNLYSIVTGDNTKDVFRVTNTYRTDENFTSYTLKNKSLAILVLTPVGAADDENVTYQYQNLVTEDFESYPITSTPYVLTKGGATSMSTFGSNWTLKTAGSVIANDNSQVSIVDGKKVQLTPTALDRNNTGLSMLEYSGDLSSLTNHFKISFDYSKASTTSGGGIKFMVHNNGKNYYVLWLGGLKEDKYKWIFSKVVNGSIVDSVNGETYTAYNDCADSYKEPSNGQINGTISANGNVYAVSQYSLSQGDALESTIKSGPIHSDGTVGIEYNKGKISWAINGYEYSLIKYHSTGSYTDASPFTTAAKNTTFGFSSNSSTSDVARSISFDDIKIGNCVGQTTVIEDTTNKEEYPQLTKDNSSTDTYVTTGEPSSAIYMERTIPYETGKLYMPTASAIRKIVNIGSTTAKVYASVEDYSYKLIAEVDAGETFTNTLNAKKYSYIKVDGGDVNVYTDMYDDMTLTAIEDVCDLMPVVKSSTEDITITSSNRNVAYIDENNKLIPLRNGTTVITASDGVNSVSKTIKVKALVDFTENFQAYTKSVTVDIPYGWAVRKKQIAGDWYLVQGNGGTMGNNPSAVITSSGLQINNAGGGPGMFYDNVGYVMYDGDYSGITDNYTIKLSYTKSSVLSGLGIRFNMHNDNQNYYMLELSSGGNGSGYVWTFHKVVNGRSIDKVNGEVITGYNADKTGPLHDDGTVMIVVNGNEISWLINGKRYNNRSYNGSGIYTDDEPFSVEPRNSRIAFVGCANRAGYSVTIKRFQLLGDGDKVIIDSPVTTGEKYIDLSGFGATKPVMILSNGTTDAGNTKVIEDSTGDKFFVLNDSAHEDKYNKMFLWDLPNAKPLYASQDIGE